MAQLKLKLSKFSTGYRLLSVATSHALMSRYADSLKPTDVYSHTFVLNEIKDADESCQKYLYPIV